MNNIKTCVYCGNNPVPHRLYWYNESLNIVLTPIRQKLLYNNLTEYLRQNRVGNTLTKLIFNLAESLKLITRQTDVGKCKVRRAQVLWEEANKRGIKMWEWLLLGRPFDTYGAERSENRRIGSRRIGESENRKSNRKIIFSGLPRPTGYCNQWLDLMDDKWLFKKLMMDNGLPVPFGGSCSGFSQAQEIFRQIQDRNRLVEVSHLPISDNLTNPTVRFSDRPILRPSVIVKPRAGSRGRHSTTFIFEQQNLSNAVKIAKKLCYWVIVEEQLKGPVYRATVIDFKLRGVLRGDPPQVTGDGSHTVAQLIKQKNEHPHPGVKDILVDEGTKRFLMRELGGKIQDNFKFQNDDILDYKPPMGELVNLSEKIGVNYGGSSSEDFEICHPDNQDLFVRAARALGDPIVGFDFIIPDISKSYKEQKCGFIEVNSLPFINLHHDPLLGEPRNIAMAVWEMIGW